MATPTPSAPPLVASPGSSAASLALAVPARTSSLATPTPTAADSGTVEAKQLATWSTCAVQSAHITSGAQRLEATGPAVALVSKGESADDADEELAFILVGSWSYPIIGQPILKDGNSLLLPAAEEYTFILVYVHRLPMPLHHATRPRTDTPIAADY